MFKRVLLLLALGLGCLAAGAVSLEVAIRQVVAKEATAKQVGGKNAGGEGAGRNRRLLQRLVDAYPDFLAGHDGNFLIWRDGTRMQFDDGRGRKSFETLLDQPDLEDQFYTPYPRGKAGLAPGRNIDPGRVRYEPLFRKMYGDCSAGQVSGKLQQVIWLPKHDGRVLKVTAVNQVAARLARVSGELDRLVDRKPDLLRFLMPPAGTYNCRVIAGTGRSSVHSFGAAIDIASGEAHYWRWSKPAADGTYEWRNRIPLEIVEVFERHGFIWGGKWYHFDTMHFEYRPELLSVLKKR